MPVMSGARFVAETMKGHGMTHIFYVPSIARKTLAELELVGIERIVCHGEKAAAYMADGYARASQKPTFCMAQSVGAANLAAGLQDAFLGLSPVIALTGHRPLSHQYRNSYQEIEHFKPFASVTKYSVAVDNVTQLPHLLRQALREATTGSPAPVHMDFMGIQGEVVESGEADMDVVVEEDFMQVSRLRPEPGPDKIRDLVQAISESRQPIIVAGGGVTLSSAGAEVRELAEMLNIPVATSLNGKQTLPGDHPLSVGVCGAYSRWCANRAVAEADLVIFIGSQTGSQVTNDWKIPPMGTPVVQIDIDPSELGRSYPTKVAVQGDAKATVRRLIEAMEPLGPRTEWVNRAQQLVREWREEVEPNFTSNDLPMRPERLCQEFTDHLPSDALLVSDTGHAGIWTGAYIDLNSPDQTYMRAAGSLGWALPAALGAKCALPDRPVVAFTGDGGFWYHIGELETAARYNIPAVIVINDNHSLNQCQVGDKRAYEAGGYTGNIDALWQFTDVDLSKVAESMGCFGIRVTQASEFDSALQQAIASGRPAIVDVVTDMNIVTPPPWG
ncbi:MAG: thiamine pyrophosphate-binding protein [Dehalococcoidia bacterium]